MRPLPPSPVPASRSGGRGPSFGTLPPRVARRVLGWLVALAIASWAVIAWHATEVAGTAMGLAQVAVGLPARVTVPLFLVMWTAMMVAMMLPATGPMVLAHRMVARRRGEGRHRTVVFVAGYLAVWTAAGLAPLAALIGFRALSADSRWLPVLAGVVLIGAGLYQVSSWKDRCLRACRNPLGFVLTHDFGGGAAAALRAGISHGIWCLGCCAGLMAVLLVVGLMNLVWMAALTVLLWAEKSWRHGVRLSQVAGTAMLVLGIAVLLRPDLLTGVA